MSGVDKKPRSRPRRGRWVPAAALLPVCLAFGSALAPLPARAGESAIPTNLGLLKSVAQTTLESILDSLAIRPGERVYVQPAAQHETNWLVAESLADLLRQRGAKPIVLGLGVSSSSPETAPAGAQGASANGSAAAGEEEDVSATDEGANEASIDEDEDSFDDEEDGDDEDQDGDGLDGDEEEDGLFGDEADENADDDNGNKAGPDGEEEEPVGGNGAVRPQGARRQPRGEEQAQDQKEAKPAPPPIVQPTAPAEPIEGEVLRFRVLELGVTYPGSKRSLLLLGPRSITRLTGAHLRVTRVEEPAGTILGVADGDHHVIDRFPGSIRAYIEGAEYPFTRPEMQPGSLGKLVEPAVVLGIVAGLVFLFYANQN